jgi:formylglycine-generating enzyme required for sulfatase activity
MTRNMNLVIALCAISMMVISCGLFGTKPGDASVEPPATKETISQETPSSPAKATPPSVENTPVLLEGVGRSRIRPADGMRMFFIPAGEFMMGENIDRSYQEGPEHLVYVGAFWMDESEVTNAMYSICVDAGACEPPGGKQFGDPAFADHPVARVEWYKAMNYCGWAGGRLPTEAEWEKAARGGLVQKPYPWGDEQPDCTPGAVNGANSAYCGEQVMPVKQFSPNGYGLYDMAGNVAEWVYDWYGDDFYADSPYENPSGPVEHKSNERVRRGGSFENLVEGLRTSTRVGQPDFLDPASTGFRCMIWEENQ